MVDFETNGYPLSRTVHRTLHRSRIPPADGDYTIRYGTMITHIAESLCRFMADKCRDPTDDALMIPVQCGVAIPLNVGGNNMGEKCKPG